MKTKENIESNESIKLFESFVNAQSCLETLSTFKKLCEKLDVKYPPTRGNHLNFYDVIKDKLPSHWQCKELWTKLDKRFYCKDYYRSSKSDYRKSGRICSDQQALVIGAGPVGIRAAIEMTLLGNRVIVVEKRESFSRNNVLHLWPFLLTDLKQLGAKKFYGRFCSGALNHVSIRQLQLILMKTALLIGVQFEIGRAFDALIPPPSPPTPDVPSEKGWRAAFTPSNDELRDFEFDVIVGADARRNRFEGFPKRELRARLAIGLTCNFVNLKTKADSNVEEISGVAYHFNQRFFEKLAERDGIELENIVYYKGDTHYFVMCAKKLSLLRRGVLKKDHEVTADLVASSNVDEECLKDFIRTAADRATQGKMPQFEFAKNNRGNDDVALFDFTRMYRAEHASRFEELHGRKLMLALVGDSLIEPFWPMGTGCARGFFAVFDLAWVTRNWQLKRNDQDPTKSSEFEALWLHDQLYRLLQFSTPSTTNQSYQHYTIDPQTRYLNMLCKPIRLEKIFHLYTSNRPIEKLPEISPPVITDQRPKRSTLTRKASSLGDNKLLNWCKNSTAFYADDVTIDDMTSSWRNGLAICAIIASFRPNLIDMKSLKADDVATNNQLAFDVAEKHLGISPVKTGREIKEEDLVDPLFIYSYVSQFYELFKAEVPVWKQADDVIKTNGDSGSSKVTSSLSNFLTKLVGKRRSQEANENDESAKKRRSSSITSSTIFKKRKSYNLQTTKQEKDPEVKITSMKNGSSQGSGINIRASSKINLIGQHLIEQWSGKVPATSSPVTSSTAVSILLDNKQPLI